MRGDEGGLSPAAQKLVELTRAASADYHGGLSNLDVSKVLQEHPELMSGLNEYMAWRDNENRMIGETKSVSPVGHEVQAQLRKLRKGKKGK